MDFSSKFRFLKFSRIRDIPSSIRDIVVYRSAISDNVFKFFGWEFHFSGNLVGSTYCGVQSEIRPYFPPKSLFPNLSQKFPNCGWVWPQRWGSWKATYRKKSWFSVSLSKKESTHCLRLNCWLHSIIKHLGLFQTLLYSYKTYWAVTG